VVRRVWRPWVWAVAAIVVRGDSYCWMALSWGPRKPPPAPKCSTDQLRGFEFSPSFPRMAIRWLFPEREKQDNFDIYVKLIGSGGSLQLTTDPARITAQPGLPTVAPLPFCVSCLWKSCRAPSTTDSGPERKLAETSAIMDLSSCLAWSPMGVRWRL